ncbi:MAG: hypothetical protein WCJ49_01695 [Deltaproteobacteria bacterium]
MAKELKYLVVLDVPGIKNYVFGTDKLVEIRGASALLDNLNRDVIPERVIQIFGTSRSTCVFAGGGAAQFIIEDVAENITDGFKTIQGEVYRQSGGALQIVIGMAQLTDNYEAALKQAFHELEKNKYQKPGLPGPSLHTGFVRECESCSGMASAMTEFHRDTRFLCAVCTRKEKMGREKGLWNEFCAYVNRYGVAPEQSWNWRPDDFEIIGDRCQARRGYTAMIYGDGNSMGRIVKQIDSADRFERFSQAVDCSVREACHEALYRHCQPVNGKMPADILLLGGDDLMVYLSADRAMAFAIDVARLFEEKTRSKLTDDLSDPFFKNILGEHGLTLSIGIAYGRSHTPIAIMSDQAEELLKSAKQKGSFLAGQQSYTPSCIDFHLTSQFNQVGVATSRKHHLMHRTHRDEQIRLYQGPYTLAEAESLIQEAHSLKESGIPRTRLHRLGEAPFMGKINGAVETLTIYGRCRNSKQKQAIMKALNRFGCLSMMPWRQDPDEISTVLVDLVRISEFTHLKQEVARHAPSNPT